MTLRETQTAPEIHHRTNLGRKPCTRTVLGIYQAMPRPRKDLADLFSYAELAIGGGMTKRDIQHLHEADDLIPHGRGTKAFKRAALVGAIMAAGVPLFSAARIAKVIVKAEFNQEDGEVPSGLNSLATKLSRDAIEKFLPDQAIDTNDYHYHYALVRGLDYRRGEALGSDAIMEIIDRHIIMTASIQFPKMQIAGWIKNWGRASEAEIIHASEKVSVGDPLKPWTEADGISWQKQWDALQAEAELSRKNAVAKITINLSLAVRNAFDRLNDYRASKEQML